MVTKFYKCEKCPMKFSEKKYGDQAHNMAVEHERIRGNTEGALGIVVESGPRYDIYSKLDFINSEHNSIYYHYVSFSVLDIFQCEKNPEKDPEKIEKMFTYKTLLKIYILLLR